MRFCIRIIVYCLGAGVAMQTVSASERVCVPWFSLRLSESPRCRVSFENYCLSETLWSRFLSEAASSRCLSVDSRVRERVRLRNEVDSSPKPIVLQRDVITWRRETASGFENAVGLVLQMRERFRLRASERLSKIDSSGMLRKLVLDEWSDAYRNNTFRALGFVHLLAATGIHLMALGTWLRFVSIILARALATVGFEPRRESWVRATRSAEVLVWLTAWSIAGCKAAMLRPLSLVLIRMAARRLGFRFRMLSALALVFAIDSLIYSLGHSGQWHYLLAVWGGIWAAEFSRRFGARNHLAQHLAMALLSWLAVAGLEAALIGWVQPYTALFSLITIPLSSLLIYPAALIGALLSREADNIFLTFASSIVSCVERGALSVERIGAILVVDRVMFLLTAATIAGFSFVVIRWRDRIKVYWVLFLVALSFRAARDRLFNGSQSSPVRGGATLIEQIDVGQGDATLVRWGSRVGLIDAGPEWSLSRSEWLELFAKRGIDHLDFVMLTHLDADHSSGVFRLSSAIRIDCVYLQRHELETERGRRYVSEIRTLVARVVTEAGRCIPFPVFEFASSRPGSENGLMAMAFVPLNASKGFYLNAGDATREGERWLMRQLRRIDAPIDSMPTRLLKLSHHGSKTSSDPHFLDFLRPTEVWVSAGFRNRYHHPNVSVLQHIENKGFLLKRTDVFGLIRWEN